MKIRMNIKITFIMLITGLACHSQTSGNEMCLYLLNEPDKVDLDPVLNKYVSKLFKELVGEEYTGHHALYTNYTTFTNVFSEVVARVTFIDYAIKNKKGQCGIKNILLVQEHLGGGKFSSGYLKRIYSVDGMEKFIRNNTRGYGQIGMMFKDWGPCDCVESKGGTNWLTAPEVAGNGGASSPVKVMHSNSNLRSEGDDIKDGPFTLKRDDGSIEETGEYKGKKKVGVWKRFRDDGSIDTKYEYGANEETYKRTDYNSKSEVISIKNFKDGKEHGIQQEFDDQGKLKTECYYNMGDKDGLYKEYYKGVLELEGTYKKGLKNGIWTAYSDGKVRYKEVWKDGEKQP